MMSSAFFKRNIMWLICAIITTLIWGTAELFYKKGARADERYAHLKICVCVGAVMGIHALFTLATQHIGYDPVNLIRYFPVSLCYIVSMALSFFGCRFIEESISDPIENTSGAICTLLCVVVLGETISRSSIVAIVMMLIGILGISAMENRGISNRSKRIGKEMAAVAFAMPFCYAILDALGSFLDIYYLDIETSPLVGVTESNIEDVANTSYELTFAIIAIILYAYIRSRGVSFGKLTNQKDKIIAAVCETAGQFTYVYAMSGNGAIAAPIISSVCVVSLVLSRIVLRERLTARQYLYLALIIAGVLMLAD